MKKREQKKKEYVCLCVHFQLQNITLYSMYCIVIVRCDLKIHKEKEQTKINIQNGKMK